MGEAKREKQLGTPTQAYFTENQSQARGRLARAGEYGKVNSSSCNRRHASGPAPWPTQSGRLTANGPQCHSVGQTLKASCPMTSFYGCGHQGQGRGGTLLCSSLDSNNDCQLDKICGHLGDKALGTPVRRFVVKGRKPYLICGYHHLMGWCRRMTGYNVTSCFHCHHHDFLPWWAAPLNCELN